MLTRYQINFFLPRPALVAPRFRCDWATCFLLHHDRPRSYLAAAHKVANFHLHQVTAPQLAIDRQVEQRSISQATPLVEAEADLQICFGLSAGFAPTVRPAFQT